MRHVALLVLLAAGAQALRAQTAADSAAIRVAALDYIEGWYTGDAARMERALHPDLAKRIVQVDSTGAPRLDHMTAPELVGATGQGFGARTPSSDQQRDVTILDVFENAASVKIVAGYWVDYLHLARWNGAWKIVNVLWEIKPEE